MIVFEVVMLAAFVAVVVVGFWPRKKHQEPVELDSAQIVRAIVAAERKSQ